MRLVFTLLLGAWASQAWGQEVESRLEFVENRGQWDARARYAAVLGAGARVFAEDGGLTYALTAGLPAHGAAQGQQAKNQPPGGPLRGHAVRVRFVAPEAGATWQATGEAPGLRHYLHGAAPARWAANARAWQQLRCRGVWPGVELVLKESADHQLEYDLLLAAGARPDRVRLRYEGAGSLRLDPRTGGLRVGTTAGTLVEHRPAAWQTDAAGQRQPVACAFRLEGQEVGFELGAYDRGRPLTIDPVVEFVSYSGSRVENWGFAATHDAAGNLYTAGVVFDPGYPATTGALQMRFAGHVDMAVVKYVAAANGPGARAWATYLGGDSLEFPHSLRVNRRGELLLLGTTSSANYPTTAGAVQRRLRGGPAIAPYNPTSPFRLYGGSDLIISHLSATGGALLASTYLGGTNTDGLLDPAAPAPRLRRNYGDAFRGDLVLDGQGNVTVASVTASADFPGAAAGSHRGGTDALVTSLDSTLGRVRWTTLLGGAGADAAHSLERDATTGALYVAGGSTSASLPATAGGYQPGPAGDVDGFVAALSPAGALTQTTFLGTARYDQAYFVRQGPGRRLYVLGQTLGGAGWPWPNLTPACYQNLNGQQFIQQLEPDLRRAGFATVVGSGAWEADISPTAFGVDCRGRIALAGWGGGLDFNGGSTLNLPTTPTAVQSGSDGADFYIMQLSDGARQLEYATFFGASADDHVDGGTSRFDDQGRLYQAVCACQQAGGTGLPLPPGATTYLPTNATPKCDNAAFKLNLGGGSAATGPDSLTVCARDNALPLGGSPLGGTWAGAGVSGSVAAGFQFQPDTLRLGVQVLTYAAPVGACTPGSTLRVRVLPQVRARLTSPRDTFCILPGSPTRGPVTLVGQPAGGQLVGAGVAPGSFVFDPVLAGPGRHQLVYFAASGPCPAVAVRTMVVRGIARVVAGGPRRVCADDGPVPLAGAPPGGVWTGPGVTGPGASGYLFTPSLALVGVRTLYYAVASSCGRGRDSLRVRVLLPGLPATVPADTVLCASTRPFRLRSGVPAGGSWSGPGVTGSVGAGFVFTPSPALPTTLTLRYAVPSPDSLRCPGRGSRRFELRRNPALLSAPDTLFCPGAGPQRLQAQPAGGTWAGPGVSGSVAAGFVFTPAAVAPGPVQLTYTGPAPGSAFDCPAAGSLALRVVAPPLVEFAPVPSLGYCAAAPPHDVTLTATPPGGRFSGPGVSANRFSPALVGPGRYTLTYTYPFSYPNLAQPCPVVVTQTVTVAPQVTVRVPADTVLCADLRPFQLRATPAGGTWAGPGVTPQGWFSPAPTPAPIILRYSAPNGCAAVPMRVQVAAGATFAARWQEPACATTRLAPRRLRFEATGPRAAEVRWTFGDGAEATGASVEHLYLGAGRYQPSAAVPGAATGPCPRQLSLPPVEVEEALVPNVITPNADDRNDTFAPRLGGCPGRLQVFSRWGQRVYEADDYRNDWDAAGLPGGLYYYVLRSSEGPILVKGWVEVIR